MKVKVFDEENESDLENKINSFIENVDEIYDIKYNVAVGVNALKRAKHTEENDTGYYNVAVGHNALPLLETGSHNTAIGFQALNKNTKGGRIIKWIILL